MITDGRYLGETQSILYLRNSSLRAEIKKNEPQYEYPMIRSYT